MMFRSSSIIVMLIALFALSSPSVAAGYDALAVSVGADFAIADDCSELHQYVPLKKQGGKRAVPCHPDLGVLVQPVMLVGRKARNVEAIVDDRLMTSIKRKADLKPPRLG